MLTVHHLGISQSERIVWLCEELSIPYELERYDRDPVTRLARERCERTWKMVEARLGEVPYFAGQEFTAADIIMLFPLTTMRAFVPRDISGCPNVLAYLQRIGTRPAYRLAMQKGDPQMTPMLT
jgi:glutathione S-transferase